MAQDKCINHPTRNAATRCKRCHAAVCVDCRVKSSDGFFCSDDCMNQFHEFQSKVNMTGTRSGCGFSIFGLIKSTIISAFLIAVIWFVLTTWLGTSDFGEMGRRLGEMFKLMF